MNKNYPFHTTFIHENRELWFQSIEQLRTIFKEYGAQLHRVCVLAEEVRLLIDSVNKEIEEMTSHVCPDCVNVCCINRHSYPEHEDLVYLLALGENPPPYEPELYDKAACRFLSPTGCTIKRSLRPFRCTWYFCPSLLQYMNDNAGPAVRKYSRKAQRLVDARRQMLEEFVRVIKHHGIPF